MDMLETKYCGTFKKAWLLFEWIDIPILFGSADGFNYTLRL